MTDSRRLRTIASRYDVEVWRQPDRKRLGRNRLTWLAGAVTIVACIPMLLGDHRPLQSQPVSSAHQTFERNCQACHDRPLAPAVRLVTFNNNFHSTTDNACQSCHIETNLDHVDNSLVRHPLLSTWDEPTAANLTKRFQQTGCAGCHIEHKGRELLQTVADDHCTRCHEDLADTISSPFTLKFHRFQDHPEFAVRQLTIPRVREFDGDSSRHLSLTKTIVAEGERIDNVALRFSHHRHLDPELPNAKRETQALQCQSCHQLDESGAYFKPIKFDSHCAECHQLGFRETGPLPHESPEILRGILLDRLASTKDGLLPIERDTLGGPTKTSGSTEALPETSAGLTSALSQLEVWETKLFGDMESVSFGGIPRPEALLETSCRKCHITQQDEQGARVPWKVVPPRIPDRWLPHGRFRHDSHAALRCDACHSQSGTKLSRDHREDFYPANPEAFANSTSIYTSHSASDILLPGIGICQECHRQSSASGGGASDRCIECHQYHHESSEVDARPELLRILEQEKSRRPSESSQGVN
ncbi:MAG: hypothetical protein KDA80_01385 [Planctomycetaceae bacterium]|nr:hypothetical protein [Planctomycetaceae bacterium]